MKELDVIANMNELDEIAYKNFKEGGYKWSKQIQFHLTIADNLPAMARNELVKLPAQKQEEFIEEYKRKAKSVGVAYILWLIGGWHYVYLRRWGIFILFWLTAGGLFIWWLIDIFRIPGMIRDYNKDIAIDVLRNLKAISG